MLRHTGKSERRIHLSLRVIFLVSAYQRCSVAGPPGFGILDGTRLHAPPVSARVAQGLFSFIESI